MSGTAVAAVLILPAWPWKKISWKPCASQELQVPPTHHVRLGFLAVADIPTGKPSGHNIVHCTLMESDAIIQEDVIALHLGLILFGEDFDATRALLPSHEVHDLARIHSHACVYTIGYHYVLELRAAGLQGGGLLSSSSARARLIKLIAAADERKSGVDKALQAAFKGYDNCSVPLLSLVEVMVQLAAGAARFCQALFKALPTCYIDPDKLACRSTCLSWSSIQGKVQQQPSIFDSCVWPALSAQGWSLQDGSNTAVFVPPAAVTHASTGHPTVSCSSAQQVLEFLSAAQEPVPEQCVQLLRNVEAEDRIAQLLAASGQADAPHRVCADPTGRLAGLPTSRRRLMCANCGVTSTRVWRVANAGLMCCNACGMFYQKHHQHRPDHLLAANRAKQDAKQAAAAAESPLQDPELCPSSSNGPSTADVLPAGWHHGAAGLDAGLPTAAAPLVDSSDDAQELRASKRQRTRRQPQVSRRLASEDYVMWDGPLRQEQHEEEMAASSDGEGMDDGHAWRAAPSYNRRAGFPEQLALEADAELELLLHHILDNRSAPSSATDESAAAALVAMKQSSVTGSAQAAGQAADAAALPVREPVDLIAQLYVAHQQQQLTQQGLAQSPRMFASTGAGVSSEHTQHRTELLPIAELDLSTSTAEAWGRIQPQHNLHHTAGSGLAGSSSQGLADSLPQSSSEVWPLGSSSGSHGDLYGGSFGIDAAALDAISQEARVLQQQLQSASALLRDSGHLCGTYGSTGAGGGFASSDGSSSGSPRLHAATSAGALYRQGSSSNSRGSSFSGRHPSSAGSADEQEGRPSGGGTKGLSISRFALEHKQAAAAASPPGRNAAPARSRSNSKRRDGQPSRCANCSCEATCLWRRDKLEPNRILCNACGIYKATNGFDRPLTGRFLARRNGKTLTVQRTAPSTGYASSRQLPGSSPTNKRPTVSWTTTQPPVPSFQAGGAAPHPPGSLHRSAAPAAHTYRSMGPDSTSGQAISSSRLHPAISPASGGSPRQVTPAARQAAAVLDLSLPGTGSSAVQPVAHGALDAAAAAPASAWMHDACVTSSTVHNLGQQPTPALQAEAASHQQQVQVLQQEHQQVVQESMEGPSTSPDDSLLERQLLEVWRHAQTLQQPVVCAASGYRVFPDGRFTKVGESELKAALSPFLQRHSSSNSSRSSQELSPAMLRMSSTGASLSSGASLPGSGWSPAAGAAAKMYQANDPAASAVGVVEGVETFAR